MLIKIIKISKIQDMNLLWSDRNKKKTNGVESPTLSCCNPSLFGSVEKDTKEENNLHAFLNKN